MAITMIQTLASMLLAVPVASHMFMKNPAPRRAPFNPDYSKKGDVNYDLSAPIGSSAGMKLPFPCGARKGPVTQTLKAGQTVNWSLGGGAPHNGGHCEISLSYDDKTFVSIQTILGNCMKNGVRAYDVTIPADAPSGPATFAWTWVNWTGNREYYMNCADVVIDGKPNGVLTGPKIVEVNMPGKPTIPEFSSANTGAQFYENRSVVSVTGNGETGPITPPPTTTQVSKPDPTTTQISKPEPTNSKPPVTKPSATKPHFIKPDPTSEPTQPEKPQPTSGSGNGKCDHGKWECSGKDYKVCVWGTWEKRRCTNGTQCNQVTPFNILCL